MSDWFFAFAFLAILAEIGWAVRQINLSAYNRNRELLAALKDIERTIRAGFFGPEQ